MFVLKASERLKEIDCSGRYFLRIDGDVIVAFVVLLVSRFFVEIGVKGVFRMAGVRFRIVLG